MATDVNLSNEDIIANSITSAGTVTAATFSGDGSQLTNVSVNPPNVFSALAFLSSDSTVNNSTAFVQKNIFPSTTGGLDINNGGFTCSTSGIVVPESGIYIVGANTRFNTTVGRAAVAITFTINSTPQTSEFQGVPSYIRNASNHEDSSSVLTGVLDLVAGDEIGLAFAQYGNSGTVNLVSTGSDASHFFIYRVS